MTVPDEIDRAVSFGQKVEELVLRREECPIDDRNVLLLGYWALLFDFHKGILSLLSSGYYGSAFALLRPVVEALVRSHLVLICSDDDISRIQRDEYRVDFAKVGTEIDQAFGLKGLFERVLGVMGRKALHSYTHSGTFQLARRFDGSNLKSSYSDGAIVEVISSTTSAVFMVTSLVAKRFGFEEEWRRTSEMYVEYGKRPRPGAD